VRFVLSPVSFHWPAPGWALSLLAGAALATSYLTVAWATTGRTYGAAVLGLRVRSAGGGPLGWTRAGLRGVLYVMVAPGLLWVVVSPRRRSVQDMLLLSVVVYDWRDDAGLLKVPGSAESPVTDGGRELAGGQRSRVTDSVADSVADNGRNPR
jgi:uncharacterized RDD family membrane protein YckC